MKGIERSPKSGISNLILTLHSIGSFRPIMRSLEQKRRRILGSYFTPIPVAQHIVNLTLHPWIDDNLLQQGSYDWTPLVEEFTLIDPACGPGSFLLAAVDCLSDQIRKTCDRVHYHEIISSFIDGLYGVDIDWASVEVAQRVLQCRLTELGIEKDVPSTHIIQGDSLIGVLSDDSRGPCEYLSDQSTHALDWKQKFEAEIVEQGGFRFVVMNPPYDRLRPSRAEYIRERLRLGEREVDMQAFGSYRADLKERVEYFRDSGEYKIANKYTLDTHRLFIERALQISRPNGRLGFIVPASVLGDLSAAALRKEILTKHSICHLEEFREGSSLFPNVTQAFCIMTVKKGTSSGVIPATFGLEHLPDSSSPPQHNISVPRIESLSGAECIIPSFSATDWQILDKMHRYPRLGTYSWVEIWRGELDLTLDKSMTNIDDRNPPLLRGSDIEKFGHSANIEWEEFVDYDAFKKKHPKSQRIGHSKRERIACQQVSNRNQRWRLKFSFVEPGIVLANSCNYLTLQPSGSESHLLYLVGLLNSSLLNWRFAVTNTNNHVSNRELTHLPVPLPSKLSAEQRGLFHVIVEEAARMLKGERSRDAGLDDHVFQLYGVDHTQARSILSSLSTLEKPVA
jgi:Alw26I/Eco31I/Esp3I family type II restriction m6 adenine DNA methyltransferase